MRFYTHLTLLPLYHGSSDSTTPSRRPGLYPRHRGQVLGNHACADDAWLIDKAVRRFASVQGAALEACAGAVSAN